MIWLERTRVWRSCLFVLAVVCFCAAVWGYGSGGSELLTYGYLNDLVAGVIMVTGFAMSIIFFVVGLAVNAIYKDVEGIIKH